MSNALLVIAPVLGAAIGMRLMDDALALREALARRRSSRLQP